MKHIQYLALSSVNLLLDIFFEDHMIAPQAEKTHID